MYTLLKNIGLSEVLKRELVPFVASFIIAEMLYKFRSFALECLAFIATWVVLSFLLSLVLPRPRKGT
jgi:hypothetical protein